jgi:LacI family transcriptional regulator
VWKGEGPGLSHLDVCYQAARALLGQTPHPRGVLCVSDQIAYGAYRFFHEKGVRVPEECEILSIDGSTFNQWLAPWLSSIRIPYDEFGPHIVDLLKALWRGDAPGDRILPYRLVH